MDRHQENDSHPVEVIGQLDLLADMISPPDAYELAVRLEGHLIMIGMMARRESVYGRVEIDQEAAAGRLTTAHLLRLLRR